MSSAAKHLLLDTETILLHATLAETTKKGAELSFPTVRGEKQLAETCQMGGVGSQYLHPIRVSEHPELLRAGLCSVVPALTAWNG